jgi:hypothetical protein
MHQYKGIEAACLRLANKSSTVGIRPASQGSVLSPSLIMHHLGPVTLPRWCPEVDAFKTFEAVCLVAAASCIIR